MGASEEDVVEKENRKAVSTTKKDMFVRTGSEEGMGEVGVA